MSNGARHGLGVVAGVVAVPVIGAGLLFGYDRLEESRRRLMTFAEGGPSASTLIGIAIMAALCAVVAVLVASRISPLASLIPGAVFTLYGLGWLIKPLTLSRRDEFLPDDLFIHNMTVGAYGVWFLIGAILLISSFVPSRWSARHRAATPAGGPLPGPGAVPPPLPGAPGAPSPMYGRSQQPYGQPPPYQPPAAPPASPGASPGPSGYPVPGSAPASPPPSPPQAPPQAPPPAKPSSGSGSAADDDAPGEWTRMYGGDDLNKGGGSSR